MRVINKRGLHDNFIIERFETGVSLLGHEVKSVRAGRVDPSVSFARIVDGQLLLYNLKIPAFQNAIIRGYNPTRTRKLLMHKSQILSLSGKVSGGGVSLIPTAIYLKNNLIKIELGLAKAKKQFDKRKVIKEKDRNRRLEQELKG
jgi:SsrA-binding protein